MFGKRTSKQFSAQEDNNIDINNLYNNVIKPAKSDEQTSFGQVLYKKPSNIEISNIIKNGIIEFANCSYFNLILDSDKINKYRREYDNAPDFKSFDDLLDFLDLNMYLHDVMISSSKQFEPNSWIVDDLNNALQSNSLFIKTDNISFNKNSNSIKIPFYPFTIFPVIRLYGNRCNSGIVISSGFPNFWEKCTYSKYYKMFSSSKEMLSIFLGFNENNIDFEKIKNEVITYFTNVNKDYKKFKIPLKISNDGKKILWKYCIQAISENNENIVLLCGNDEEIKQSLKFIFKPNVYKGVKVENHSINQYVIASPNNISESLNNNCFYKNRQIPRKTYKVDESFNIFKRNRQIPRKMNNYTHRMNESFLGDNPVYAAINIDPSTPLNLNQGDEVTASMFRNPNDKPIADLVSIGDTAIIDDILDDGTYKLVISVSEPDSASDLYNWIIENTNATDDDTIEQYVAPGLIELMNDSDIDNSDDSYDDIDDSDLDDLADEADTYNESVSSKFSKYRNLYESAVSKMNESDSLNEKDDKEDDSSDSSDDDLSDLFSDDSSNDINKDDSDSSDDDSKGDDEQSDDSEDVPMTAVVLTVKKDDVDKCKDEMVSAGIPDEDIEILDGEDDDENAKIKVDANSVKELKDYLQGKGIDLEEKIGGEIIDDEEGDEDSSDEDKDKDDNDKDKEDGDDTPSDDFDMSDLFGDDDDDNSDDKK